MTEHGYTLLDTFFCKYMFTYLLSTVLHYSCKQTNTLELEWSLQPITLQRNVQAQCRRGNNDLNNINYWHQLQTLNRRRTVRADGNKSSNSIMGYITSISYSSQVFVWNAKCLSIRLFFYSLKPFTRLSSVSNADWALFTPIKKKTHLMLTLF